MEKDNEVIKAKIKSIITESDNKITESDNDSINNKIIELQNSIKELESRQAEVQNTIELRNIENTIQRIKNILQDEIETNRLKKITGVTGLSLAAGTIATGVIASVATTLAPTVAIAAGIASVCGSIYVTSKKYKINEEKQKILKDLNINEVNKET